MSKDQTKEPIRKKWIWIGLVIIMLGIVPWYFPRGTEVPIILGFPYWALISLFFSLLLCGYLSWLCVSQWNIVEDIEENED
ncbi:hypothetical protein [Jeotgalibacillus proteolyticus]|uniref:Uncharacterized protein n=1 Tax=Jeotgalibacillus proteolyticus TaxID=2082395 RepID=A0A2S5G7S0_9BACL|nr:hypothetical protein [Jeotgalibacillus proteolyticus]PPA69029.1 hypothetical protein C4B60_17075 [Jeotgalibacillus proteolyticus]